MKMTNRIYLSVLILTMSLNLKAFSNENPKIEGQRLTPEVVQKAKSETEAARKKFDQAFSPKAGARAPSGAAAPEKAETMKRVQAEVRSSPQGRAATRSQKRGAPVTVKREDPNAGRTVDGASVPEELDF